MASFLLGAPSLIEQDYLLASDVGMRSTEYSAYVADDWRATQRLTLNLGLRYELDTPFTEVDNLWASFDPNTATVLVAGRNGVSRTAGVKTFTKGFAPRLGFAYQVAQHTVVRGGAGLFWNTPGQRRRRAAVAPPRAVRADLQLQPRHPVRHAARQRRLSDDSAARSGACRHSQRQRDRRRSELSARVCRTVQSDGRTGIACGVVAQGLVCRQHRQASRHHLQPQPGGAGNGSRQQSQAVFRRASRAGRCDLGGVRRHGRRITRFNSAPRSG